MKLDSMLPKSVKVCLFRKSQFSVPESHLFKLIILSIISQDLRCCRT